MARNENSKNDYQVINELRVLAIDMINEAKSGHPGVCLGAATVLYTLFSRHLRINRLDNKWYDRDRFILSAGHAVPLLYAIMHYLDMLTLDDLKELRHFGSKTPGHPNIKTDHIECTTGPLGEGVATSCGLGIAERYLNSTIDCNLINHYTYVFLSEGDLMEGITYEAFSLIGHLKLNKMIFLFDSNKVTLDGELDNSFSENIALRMKSMGFNTLSCSGDDIKDIDKALNKAKKSSKPSFIICNTTIGKYSARENNHLVHGLPLDQEDIKNIKKKLGLPITNFNVNDKSKKYFINLVDKRMNPIIKKWEEDYKLFNKKKIINDIIIGKNTYDVDNIKLDYNNNLLGINHDILNYISNDFPLLIGGTADVMTSTKVYLDNESHFKRNNYSGRNLDFGVREQLMGAVMNGLALANLRPFGACFLTFSNYMINSIRMSAIMNLPVIYYFTHDSLTTPENGTCHVPIEQITMLESIPNLMVYHPYDANELLYCYQEILSNKKPAVILLSKDHQTNNIIKDNKISDGAYIIKHEKHNNYITLVASGEELGVTLEVSDLLNKNHLDTRVISIPCMKNYLKKPFNLGKNVIAISYGLKYYYYPITKNVIGLDNYVSCGTKEEVLNNYSLTKEKIVKQILSMIGKSDENEK